MTRLEKIFLSIFALTLVVGIWHALPQTTVVGDESIYVGGVLRALEAHTVVPQIDASYTLSFYANYILMVPVVAVIFLLNHLHLADTIAYLYAHYDYLYLVPRAVSLLASLGIAYVLLRLARLEGHDEKSRLLAAILILSPIIIAVIMHTGKMWALSCLLIILADYFYTKKNIFWCVGAAFLAVANFPLAFIAFAAPALLWWRTRDEKSNRSVFVRAGVFWLVVAGLLTLLNLHGWTMQNAATPTGGVFAPVSATLWQLALLFYTFPLLLAAILLHLDQIKNRALFWLGIAQAGVFTLLVSLRAPWVLGSTDYLRYYFLIGLLLGVALLATSLHRRTVLAVLCAISLIFFAKTLYLLAVPTTYNLVYDQITTSIAKQPVVVFNPFANLDLPRNAKSFALLKDNLCASRCQYELAHPTSPYLYTVITGESDPQKTQVRLAKIDFVIASTSNDYYSINHSLGLYTLEFLALPRLGETIYVHAQ